MTGIFGVYRLDERPCEAGVLVEMADSVDLSAWLDGAAGLALQSDSEVPPAAPFEHEASGCAIAGDVRFDNRTDVVRALRLDEESRTALSDTELALSAYLAWGDACVQRLAGDFAFGIWDPRQETIFCARDRMGMRSLTYHHAPHRVFAFATSASAVARCPGVPHQVNESRIADYLLETLEGVDKTSTFFAGVDRLPPGHAIVVSQRGARCWRYWAPEPGPVLRLPTDAEYAEAFREALVGAVASRTACPAERASMLSGGIDSGTIVALNRSRASSTAPFVTFSGVSTRGGSDPETRAIYASLEMEGIQAHVISADELDNAELLRLAASAEEPFDGNMTLPRAMYLAAHRAGLRSLLDGAGADVVLSPGRHLARMLRAGRFRAARAEALAEDAFWSGRQPAFRELGRAARAAFVPAPLLARLRSLRGRRDVTRAMQDSPLNRDFAARVDVAERLERLASHQATFSSDAALERAAVIDHPYLTAGRERYDRVARALGVRAADPYLDHRVISLCLALPDDQLIRKGWPKYIARQATEGSLPDQVRWRRGREHLGWMFTSAVVRSAAPDIYGALEDGLNLLEPYVDSARIPPLALRLAEGDAESQGVAYTLYCLVEWLRRHAGSRAASGGEGICTARIATRRTKHRS
ncbi:MAG TPA: asparagine synthase-related protein [Gaiellaceae bacterium]|nr:asparagine synthase-related protein [Gaiellaceae bacterium]